jgi:hypothetical protein
MGENSKWFNFDEALTQHDESILDDDIGDVEEASDELTESTETDDKTDQDISTPITYEDESCESANLNETNDCDDNDEQIEGELQDEKRN